MALFLESSRLILYQRNNLSIRLKDVKVAQDYLREGNFYIYK